MGLHVRGRCLLHSVLLGYRCHRQSCGMYLIVDSVYILIMCVIVFALQVLNLFLALLLSNFGSSSLSAPTADNDTNKIAEAFNRIGRFKSWVKRNIAGCFKLIRNKLTNQISDQPSGERTNQISWIWSEGFYPLVYQLLQLLLII